MESKVDELATRFRAIRSHFESTTVVFENHIRAIISKANIDVLDISSRTKEVSSLDGKLRSKKAEGYDALTDVTDLTGVCVVVYFEDDIKPLVRLLSDTFAGGSGAVLVDKLQLVDAEKFGYRAHHLTINLIENLTLDLIDVEPITGFWGEIQIRTAFMHAWAKVEHKYNYKASAGSSEVKRGFARLASLVELADRELCEIHDWFINNEPAIISAATVGAAISSSENQIILRELAKEAHQVKHLGSNEAELERTKTILQLAGFTSISLVKVELLNRQHALTKAMHRFFLNGLVIRPQSPIEFLAFEEVISRRQISGLVELIQVAIPFEVEDDLEMLDYCRRIYSCFLDH